ncbi:MAG: formylglycine-generating enzyme family protein, partial [Burkholderiales bacterium]|nr:formylglycine-generating enzyme family protein [Burkholderiales bacterium]
DVQKFCSKLALQGASATLPTEAEWEFACRAGSTTPFSFGANISTRQANYDGNYPYADGEVGEFREQTVSVRALPANAWGLYQMHGNVWEWCVDTMRQYSAEEVTNPSLAQVFANEQSEDLRLLRGGGWIGGAMDVSAASRFGTQPDRQGNFIGFRFVLRPSKANQASRV